MFRIQGLDPNEFRHLIGLPDADLADGADLVSLMGRFFTSPDIVHLHTHYAKRGCYAARIVRA